MSQSSGATATFHAYFGYRDAVGALRWLEKAFGFETTMEVPDGNGGIAHAEVRYGGVAFTLFTDEVGYERPARKGDTVGHGVYVAVDERGEVEAIYRSAVAAGAESVWEPEESEWGNYRCRVADVEGYEWTFGTHRPGAPADW
ncbi:glyoxalase [Kribbella sandramycini]|uniref:Glyoxalase n=1 Tax=Kribbella sandramycini TaxID=60450 RepID=A0A7Y4KZ47_9ACTN|nr:VOC family protein [Kribbella sandramycini]MBB6565069.1 putative glyoxalase superfamily protein PhnB [Kribbella sandramycini]NOL41340.1 glyoxalase [Kribbella sandramycini]